MRNSVRIQQTAAALILLGALANAALAVEPVVKKKSALQPAPAVVADPAAAPHVRVFLRDAEGNALTNASVDYSTPLLDRVPAAIGDENAYLLSGVGDKTTLLISSPMRGQFAGGAIDLYLPPAGAADVSIEIQTDEQPLAASVLVGGEPYAPGASGRGKDTAPGACCLREGGCTVTDRDSCIQLGGGFLGEDTVCETAECPPVPENDACADALDVGPLPASVTFDNTLADSDVTDPCGVASGPFNAVWYTVVGTGNTMTATTCNDGTRVSDTKISVWCGTCNDLNCIDGNDDNCGQFNFFSSTVTWCSEPGVTYFIAVGNFSSSTSSGQIQLDVFDNAETCTGAVPCIINGACCLGAACTDQAEIDCAAQGGAYLGDDTSCVSNLLQDPGFEAGQFGGVWTEFSTNFGTPICSLAGCGFGGGTGPRTGNYWAWFGGINIFEEGSVAQTVVIPPGATQLGFYLEVPVCGNAADNLTILIDGNLEYSVDGGSALCGQIGYVQQLVDISAYADGAAHTITFFSTITGGETSNFFVDDVSIFAPLDNVCSERAHPGWNWADVGIDLTANQPTYWSAATGQPATGGVSPFTILDPGVPPGRPDPDGSSDRVLRGFIVAWAVNATGAEIRWNHLKGDAVVVNYADGSAWEYNAYSFQAVNPAIDNGDLTGSPGVLGLDGVEYDNGYDLLLLDFYASGSRAFSPFVEFPVDTDLTLMPLDMDLRQETGGPVTTKASFTVWNQNEIKFTGLDRCVTCWDEALFSRYLAPNHLLVQNLQTNKGKAQIDGLASQVCNVDYDPGDGLALGADPRDVVSSASSLLGLAAKYITFDGAGRRETAGMNLVGMGTQRAQLLADVSGTPPPERPTIGNDPIVVERELSELTTGGQPIPLAPNDRTSSSEKGSLLIFPKVELRWDSTGTRLIQDTFIDITNDYPEDVDVQMYFVNGDPPLAATP